MQIVGQMMRVPLAARQKFNEAAYFYNGMLANRNNVIEFPYHLSAFLSAFRSVTFYLQKQYAHEEWFQSWYSQRQAEMAADPLLRMLGSHRTGIVHREPLDLFFARGFTFPQRFGGCIETDHFEVTYDQAADGQAITRVKVGANGVEEEVPTQISWHFTQEDRQDVAEHCYLGLQKLDGLLKLLTTLRASLGLAVEEGPAEGLDLT